MTCEGQAVTSSMRGRMGVDGGVDVSVTGEDGYQTVGGPDVSDSGGGIHLVSLDVWIEW